MESLKRKESLRAADSSTLKSSVPPSATFGRYVLHAPIARGGMATIYIARLIGAEGFSRIVAAKRLHPQFTEDPEFVTMFHDEARIASRIHHPNVVPVLDVVLQGAEVVIVQEYVHGAPLDKLFNAALEREDTAIPVSIVSAVMSGVLAGLDAAHETKDEMGEPLAIVHRDVSPQNVMVSLEGVPRLLDFGIAKARSSAHVTREGFFKGKVAYMAPEQLRAEEVSRSADIYACGVMLWELLAHRRLHAGRGEAEMFHAVLSGAIPALTSAFEDGAKAVMDDARWRALKAVEPIVTRALAMRPQQRFNTANDMLRALQVACPPATPSEVAEWVKAQGAEYLEKRQNAIAASEESWRSHSRIAAASSIGRSDAPVESMARVVMRDPMLEALPPESRIPSSASRLAPTPFDAPFAVGSLAPQPFYQRHLPWVIAGALLLVVGVLLGVVLSSRSTPEVAGPAPTVAPQAAPPAAVAAAPDPTPTTPPSATAPPTDPVATASASHATSHAAAAPFPGHAAPPPARFTAPARPAPAPRAAAAPPAPSHVAAAPPPAPAPSPAPPQPSAKADCDPPFYFDGTKKVFKPACL